MNRASPRTPTDPCCDDRSPALPSSGPRRRRERWHPRRSREGRARQRSQTAGDDVQRRHRSAGVRGSSRPLPAAGVLPGVFVMKSWLPRRKRLRQRGFSSGDVGRARVSTEGNLVPELGDEPPRPGQGHVVADHGDDVRLGLSLVGKDGAERQLGGPSILRPPIAECPDLLSRRIDQQIEADGLGVGDFQQAARDGSQLGHARGRQNFRQVHPPRSNQQVTRRGCYTLLLYVNKLL